jgi:hypothetical protein
MSNITRTLYGGYRGLQVSVTSYHRLLVRNSTGNLAGDCDSVLRQRIWVRRGGVLVKHGAKFAIEICASFFSRQTARNHIFSCTARQVGPLETASFCRTFESFEDNLWGVLDSNTLA